MATAAPAPALPQPVLGYVAGPPPGMIPPPGGTTPEHVAALATAVEAWIAEHVLKADRYVADFIRRRSSAA